MAERKFNNTISIIIHRYKFYLLLFLIKIKQTCELIFESISIKN